ncbi:MAG: Uma2 family endonuclease [Dehalococcoidia bacterium]
MTLKSKIRFKAEDIWDTPDDGKRYEVIDGALFVTPPPGWGHQRSLNKLGFFVSGYVYERNLGEVAQAPVGVVLDDENGIEPDLIYVSKERLHIISERGVEGAPDLIVEVLSPSTQSRDKGIKMRRYAAAGVPRYWMLDYRRHFLEAHRLGEQGYELTGRYGPGDIFRPEIFPGLEIAIDDLWA